MSVTISEIHESREVDIFLSLLELDERFRPEGLLNRLYD